MKLLAGPVDYTDDAREWYNDWYDKYSNQADIEGEGWVSRIPDHMLRTAICLQVCEDMTLILKKPILQAAYAALRVIEDSMPAAFAQIGIHAGAGGIDRIIDVLKKGGGKATNWDIYDKTLRFFSDPIGLKRAMVGLMQVGWIKRDSFDAQTATEVFSLVRPDLRMGSTNAKNRP